MDDEKRSEPASESLPEKPASKPSGWRAALAMAVVLVAIVVSQTILGRKPEEAPPENAGPQVGLATLVVDRGEGTPLEQQLPIAAGTTALDLLESATAEGVAPIGRRNEKEWAFVDSIGGVENEGDGGRNWLYWVNGERGEVGAGVKPLADGDRVLWKFAPYE